MADQPEDQVPLLQDLQTVGNGLSPADIPHVNDVPALVGAIVKHLEHEGASVADDIRPAEPVPAASAAPPGADTAEVSDLVNRLRAIVEAGERQTGVDRPDTAPAGPSTAPAVGAETAAAPDPNASSSPGVPTAAPPDTPPAAAPAAPAESPPASPPSDPAAPSGSSSTWTS